MEFLTDLNLILSVFTKSLLLIILIVVLVISLALYSKLTSLLNKVNDTTDKVKEKVDTLASLNVKSAELLMDTATSKLQVGFYRFALNLIKKLFKF